MVSPDQTAHGESLACRGCGTQAQLAVDLGRQPASDLFPAADSPMPDPAWPLELWWCPQCALVQLGPVEALAEEPIRAVESETSRAHARHMASAVLQDFPGVTGGSVREFASHHGGSWLEALAELGCHQAKDGEPASLVVDAHALAHEQDVAGCFATLAKALAPEGILVLEHHHLLALVEQGQFDTIRHGHWSYLSLTAVQRLGRNHGLRVIQAVIEPVFGGSLRVVLAHEGSDWPVDDNVGEVLAAERRAGLHDGSGLTSFDRRATESASALKAFVEQQRELGRTVLAYGAPSKAAILLGVSDIDQSLLDFTVDAAPLKHGLVIPGVRIPIRPVSDLVDARPDVVLILTWDIAEEVVTQLESAGGWGAQYVLPLPAPHDFVLNGMA